MHGDFKKICQRISVFKVNKQNLTQFLKNFREHLKNSTPHMRNLHITCKKQWKFSFPFKEIFLTLDKSQL